MLSVNEIAAKFGVDKVIAYGLVRFLAQAGIVETTTGKLEPGKRGKSPLLYGLDKACGERLTALFVEKLANTRNIAAGPVPTFAKSCEVPSAECFSGGCG